MSKSLIDSEINDPVFVSGIIRNQTIDLINKFKERFPTGKEGIVRLAERVNLMTPENIHINSFMYEPILDMSSHHLKELYRDVCSIESKKPDVVAVEVEAC